MSKPKEEKTINVLNEAYKFYRKALVLGLLAQIICTGAICWLLVCKETSLDETGRIILLISAIAVILFATASFIRKAERDYETKRNHELAKQRRINRERFIDAFAEELYNLQQRTEKKSSTTCEYRDLPDHEKEPFRDLAEKAIIRAGY